MQSKLFSIAGERGVVLNVEDLISLPKFAFERVTRPHKGINFGVKHTKVQDSIQGKPQGLGSSDRATNEAVVKGFLHENISDLERSTFNRSNKGTHRRAEVSFNELIQ